MTGGPVVVGIDTGGTFTDFVVVDGSGTRIHKELSTPDDPARAIIAGLRALLGDVRAAVVHGSTVATNAVLERKGARTALLTTAGFEDVLEIGRQTRTRIYDLDVEKEPPFVPADRRVGLRERTGPDGEVIAPLAEADLLAALETLRGLEPESVAICFLHAYANPDHERRAAEGARRALRAFVTASHEVLPEFREYERTSTTVANAYVGPVMSRYLSRLAEQLEADTVRIMQSNGGIISLAAAQRHAVQTILSGPAGGAVGGFEIARRAGFDHVITFDMGGTSTDVSLCAGALSRTSETKVGEIPIRVPVIDIHTVGAGGGSIAYRDPGGSLRVGPRSAGADPGPICYGQGGTELTVTDANLFLGRLSPEHFLGGHRTLPVEPVRDAMTRFADAVGITVTDAAEGIIRVANATMERAIRVISLERGFDPRDFTLVCFGGAGAMHAADLARGLGLPRIIVPRAAGALSALGMLLADFIRDYSRTVMAPADAARADELERAFLEMEERARDEYGREGFPADRLQLERALDMRYVGQGFEIAVPMGPAFATAFHRRHEQRFGYADPGRPTEVVNVRVRAVGVTDKPPMPTAPLGDSTPPPAAFLAETTITFEGAPRPAKLVDREALEPGNVFPGPALVVEYSTTTVIPPDFACRVDGGDNLILTRASDDASAAEDRR